MPSDFHLHDTQQVMSLPGFCISTKVGGHKTIIRTPMIWLHMVIFCYPSLFTSGDFTDTLGLNAEGITGRVLLILTGVISLVVWVLEILFVAVYLYDAGKHIPV